MTVEYRRKRIGRHYLWTGDREGEVSLAVSGEPLYLTPDDADKLAAELVRAAARARLTKA